MRNFNDNIMEQTLTNPGFKVLHVAQSVVQNEKMS